MTLIGTPVSIAETVLGALFFVTGFASLALGLGVVSAKTSPGPARWLRWLGGWRPSWRDETPETLNRYRPQILGSLIALLVGAVLVIPGIGEDRMFVLSRFYDLWGTVFYFYTMIVLVSSVTLVFYRRTGGYVLSLVVSIITIGISVPDMLGLLPPAPPTLKTSIILAANSPFAIYIALLSWMTIRHQTQ